MLEIRGLSVNAGSFSLDDVYLTVEDSQYHVIIGPTGSGKTLFLESVIGLRKPLKGNILLDGKDIQGKPVEKRGFSYVPQDLAIFPHLTVEENIFYGLRMRKVNDTGLKDLPRELIDAMGIGHLLKRTIENLSGGERQRVALARALAPGYKYILLDEPLSSLHEAMKKELWFLLRELQQRYKFIMLMVTQSMEEAFFLGDTVSIMINGRLHQTGNKTEVYRHPRTIEVARFLGIRNLFEAEVIESIGNEMTVRCNDLNCNFVIPIRPFTDSSIHRFTIGIRAEDVIILGAIRQEQYNLLKGRVLDIFEKGASHTVLFLPERSQQYLEVEVPDYAFRKLKLRKNQDVFITVRGENIFLI